MLDDTVLAAYLVFMIGVGFWARRRIADSRDFFIAGGSMPWWLAGISHHMSGYSSAVFVGYAAIAYTVGFSLYIWWSCSIAGALVVGAILFAPRWARLRERLGVVSTTEYLALRYGRAGQQAVACCGTLLKVFDVGAKWTASSILMHVFVHTSFGVGIVLIGGVTLAYSVMGGLWADVLTDFSQFGIQTAAAMAMLWAVLMKLGGLSGIWTLWPRLPAGHSSAFSGQYGPLFATAFFLVSVVSYNGGTWNLAQRFMASPSPAAARRAALLSAALYLLWAPILFFPMWAAPAILPRLADPAESYARLTHALLPHGLTGLVLAGLLAHTMAMTSSDANAVSAVIVRDILPVMLRLPKLPAHKELALGRLATVLFLVMSMMIGCMADRFGGVMGLILLWYGALVGPIGIPLLLGLLPTFRYCGAISVFASIGTGAVTFVTTKLWITRGLALAHPDFAAAASVGAPALVAFCAFCVAALGRPDGSGRWTMMQNRLDEATPDIGAGKSNEISIPGAT